MALAVGRSDWVAAGSLVKVAGIAAFVSLGFSFFGFPGAVLGVLGATAIRYVVSVLVVKMLGFGGQLMDLRYSVRVAISAVAGWLAVQWVTNVGFDNAFLHAIVVFVVVTAFWARPLLLLLQRTKRGKPIFRKSGQSEPTPAA